MIVSSLRIASPKVGSILINIILTAWPIWTAVLISISYHMSTVWIGLSYQLDFGRLHVLVWNSRRLGRAGHFEELAMFAVFFKLPF